MMKRTQLYIPEHLHQTAKVLATRQERPLADFLRTILDVGIQEQRRKIRSKSLEPLIRLKLRGGPKDLSKNLKRYLYG